MKVTTLSASLVSFLATTSAVSAYLPQPPHVRVGIVQARDTNNHVRRHVMRGEHALPFERRAPNPQIEVTPSETEGTGNNPPPNQSTSSSSQETGGNGNTSSSTTPPAQPPPTTTSSSSTPPTNEQPTTPTTTTSDAPQTSSTVTTTVNTSVTTTVPTGTTIRNTANTQIGTTRTASQGTYTNLRGSQTSSSATSTSTSSGTTPFMKNKGAVAATAVVVSLVAVGALVFVGFWLKKKNQRGKMGDDTWDEASMKEFPPVSHHGAGAGSGVVIPPPLMTTSGGLGRSNTVLPSQSAGASPLARTKSHSARSHEDDGYGHSDEPDEILAMPPVKNYERPRDSAFDIVPPPPPAAIGGASGSNTGYSPTAYSPGGYNNYGYGNAYASTSAAAAAGLEPPKRKGDHTSYGSGVGVDPFAGTGFVDATREASYGQAGRGAGYSNNNSSNAAYGGHYGGSDEDAYDGNAVAGPSRSNYQAQTNQWGQAYNPYQGYGQASGSGSGGYGGYGYAN
ncbi:hypothetical protein CPB86DRAFT_400511 [Serendipita vermifera]|nr:hypothetical protein CPB86DRAFT_400511 [Serendipita vermifera]